MEKELLGMAAAPSKIASISSELSPNYTKTFTASR